MSTTAECPDEEWSPAKWTRSPAAALLLLLPPPNPVVVQRGQGVRTSFSYHTDSWIWAYACCSSECGMFSQILYQCRGMRRQRGDAALGGLQKDTWPQRPLYISVPGEGSHDVTATPSRKSPSSASTRYSLFQPGQRHLTLSLSLLGPFSFALPSPLCERVCV